MQSIKKKKCISKVISTGENFLQMGRLGYPVAYTTLLCLGCRSTAVPSCPSYSAGTSKRLSTTEKSDTFTRNGVALTSITVTLHTAMKVFSCWMPGSSQTLMKCLQPFIWELLVLSVEIEHDQSTFSRC